jgi:ABC-type sugar transport system ATPase subunit
MQPRCGDRPARRTPGDSRHTSTEGHASPDPARRHDGHRRHGQDQQGVRERFAGKRIILGLRPEHLPAASSPASGPLLTGNVDLVEALGSELVVHFTIDARRVRAEGATAADEDATAAAGESVARVDPGTTVKVGDKLTFAVNPDGMQFFDHDTENAIWT